MGKPLTKKDKINAEEQRISQLTNSHDAHFKVIVSHQIEPNYKFGSLNTNPRRRLTNADTGKVYKALGKFLDESTKLTITEVETGYLRYSDPRDGTYDPETKSKAQVHHLCLYKKGAVVNRLTDRVRLHGYFRNNGYFVVTRLDWHHLVHRN